MSTKREFARKYADRIQKAARGTRLLESTTRAPELESTILEVLRLIDGLQEGDEPAPESTKREVRELVDEELSVSTGTLRQLKEGSVRSLIDYQRQVVSLLTQIRARNG